MPAKITLLTKAVVELINAAQIPNCPEAVRVTATRFRLIKDKSLLDVLAGEDRDWSRLNRSDWSDAPSVDVLIYQKVPANNVVTDEYDTAAEHAEAIVELFKPVQKLAGYRFVTPSMQPMDPEWTIQNGIAGFIINLKFSDP